MSAVSRSRQAARVVLYEIARPYFSYPKLEDSWWYLPEVVRWQPWEPAVAPPRASRGLVGKLIVPSLVHFHIPPHVYIKSNVLFNDFGLHLKQRTGSQWELNNDNLAEHYVSAERLDYSLRYTDPDGHTTHTLALPGSPVRAKRRSLVGSLVRGILFDEYSREVKDDDGTTGYPSGDGEESN